MALKGIELRNAKTAQYLAIKRETVGYKNDTAAIESYKATIAPAPKVETKMSGEQIQIRDEQQKLLAINRATNAAIMSGKFPQKIVDQMNRNVERNSERLSFLFKSFLRARSPYRTSRLGQCA